VLVALLERSVVLEFLALARCLDALSGRCVSSPEPDVAVVGAGEDVGVVGGPGAGEDALLQ